MRKLEINNQCYLRFQDLYGIAKELSKIYNVSFGDSFDYILEFRDPKYSKQEILKAVFKNGNYCGHSENRRKTNPNSDVWVVFGETGQGKSAFINSLCEAHLAPEGKGIKSETKDVNLYSSEKHNLLLVDTPGLFDTRQITNQTISDEIVDKVQERLQENSNIKAIFFTWCPNFSLRLRLDEMLGTLEKALGPSAIDSVVFLINQVSRQWTRMHDEACKEFANELAFKGLRNPKFVFDFKQLNASQTINTFKNTLRAVKPFRDSDFENYRIQVCFEKYLGILEADDKKEEETQRIEKRVSDRFQNRMQQLEQRHSEDIRRIQEQHFNELRKRDEQIQVTESRVSDKFKTEMQLMEQRHFEDFQRIQERHSKELRERTETDNERIKQITEENSRHQQEIRALEQKVSSQQDSRSYDLYQSHPSCSFLSILPSPFLDSFPSYSSYPSLPINMIGSTHSTSNLSGGGKFYKGGQFTPGGGRAPKGGVWR